MQEIASQIAAIRADTEHGATFLTQEALTVLKDAATVIPEDTSWEDSLTWVGKTLTEAKTPMAGLANATDRFLQKLLKLGPLAQIHRRDDYAAAERAIGAREGDGPGTIWGRGGPVSVFSCRGETL